MCRICDFFNDQSGYKILHFQLSVVIDTLSLSKGKLQVRYFYIYLVAPTYCFTFHKKLL